MLVKSVLVIAQNSGLPGSLAAQNIARTCVSQEEVLTNNKMIIWRIIEDIGAIRTKLFLYP